MSIWHVLILANSAVLGALVLILAKLAKAFGGSPMGQAVIGQWQVARAKRKAA